MTVYKINLKLPHQATIWAGPETVDGILKYKEDDRAKTKREAIGNRLVAVGAKKVSFDKRNYCFTAELPPEIEKEVSSWEGVRQIIKKS